MKLLTWNINGLRSMKIPMKAFLDGLDADIICFQETKITRDQLDSDLAIVDGYSSYFSFSQARQGYSGVATYCKETMTPINSQEGLFHFAEKSAGRGKIDCYGRLKSLFTDKRMTELDKEGRTIITQHEFKSNKNNVEKITIINVYCPRADPEKPDRKEYKLDFYRALEERANSIFESGSHVIICGDVNTSHKRIDHCDPDGPELFYDNPCREWMDKLLYKEGNYSLLNRESLFEDTKCCQKETRVSNNMSDRFVDTFRYFFPTRKDAFTCWCTLKGCRKTNYGTRIDYILANAVFHSSYVTSCDIHPEIYGSDHCPVKAFIDIQIKPATKYPPICMKHIPEFKGRQQTLSKFFSEKTSSYSEIVCPANLANVSLSNNNLVSGKRKLGKQAVHGGKSKQTKLDFFSKGKSLKTQPQTSKANLFLKIDKPVALNKSSNPAASFWKSVLKGPGTAPCCSGHNEQSLLRTVRKEGANFGKQFYVCRHPEGHKTNPDARCSFFQWKE